MKSNQALIRPSSNEARTPSFHRFTPRGLVVCALALAASTLIPLAYAGEVDPAPTALPGAARSTREQVRSERTEAQRKGETANGETGQTAREANPKRYPAVARPEGKTRQQVKAETSAAMRTGDMTDAESGRKLNELNPKRYEKARQAEGMPASAGR